MKKTIIWMLIAAFVACLLISCGETPVEMTTGTAETTATTAQEVHATQTTETTTEIAFTEITTAMTEPTETTTTLLFTETEVMETTTWVTGTTYDILPEFQGFMEFDGKDRGYFWQGKADITDNDLNGFVGAVFRIIGVKNPNYYDICTIYYAQVVDVYGIESFDSSIIYCLAYKGTYEKTLYGRPPLEIGKDYLYIIENDFMDIPGYEKNEYMPLVQMGLMMPLKKVEDKTYVYGYGLDFGNLECAIEIEDDEENQIYKVGKHDAIIAKLNDIGVRLPTFDYKCELEEMLRAIEIID